MARFLQVSNREKRLEHKLSIVIIKHHQRHLQPVTATVINDRICNRIYALLFSGVVTDLCVCFCLLCCTQCMPIGNVSAVAVVILIAIVIVVVIISNGNKQPVETRNRRASYLQARYTRIMIIVKRVALRVVTAAANNCNWLTLLVICSFSGQRRQRQ